MNSFRSPPALRKLPSASVDTSGVETKWPAICPWRNDAPGGRADVVGTSQDAGASPHSGVHDCTRGRPVVPCGEAIQRILMGWARKRRVLRDFARKRTM